MTGYFIQDLIEKNIITLEMLDNILGPVAVLKLRNSRVRVSWCNEQFCQLTGFGGIEEILAKDDLAECIYPDDVYSFLDMFTMAENALPKGCINRGRYVKPDGHIVMYKANCFYLRYDGEYKYFYVSFLDVTEQHYQRLRLQAAMKQNKVNYWDWNILDCTCTIYTDVDKKSIHPGIDFLDQNETVFEDFPYGFVRKYDFPADYKESFVRYAEKMLNGVDLSNRDLEFPLIQSDGKLIWFSVTCQSLRDDNGHLGHIIGTYKNITSSIDERNQNKYNQHVREALLKQAMYDLTINLTSNFLVEDNSKEQLCAEAGVEFHTYTDYIDKMGNQLIMPDHREKFLNFFNRERLLELLEKDESTLVLEYQRMYNGTPKWFRLVANPFRMDPDDDIWLYFLVYDIDDTKQREKELERLAATDSLTGLFNRSYTVQLMEEHIKAYPNENAAVIFVDLDNFKQVNDTMGHAVGDDILICVAAVFREFFGDNSILGRIGGDEFLMMYYGFEREELQGKLESLIDYIHETCNMLCPDIPVTASVGYIVYPDDGINFYSLIDKADKALYTVKSSGKNSALHYDESMDD